jgi:hypothetical protein
VVATIGARTKVEHESTIGMRFPEEHLYLFDREDGTAVRHPTAEQEELAAVPE